MAEDASRIDRRTRVRLQRALLLARLALAAEQSARVWTPLILAAGALAVAGLWGVYDVTPPMLHGPVTFSALGLGLGLGAMGARGLRWPSRDAARVRLERDSGLVHAPLSVLEEDQPAVGDAALWTLHRQRTLAAARRARVRGPGAGLAAADPFALRYVLLVAAALALWAKGPDRAGAALYAFRPVGEAAAVGSHLAHAAGAAVLVRLGSGDNAKETGARQEGRSVRQGVR